MRPKVLVTRAQDDAPPWVEALEEAGFEACVLPCLETRVLDDSATRARLRDALRGARWLALSSARGAEACARLLEEGLPETVRVAAVGPRTAEAARERLGRVDLVSERGQGRDLAERLAEALAASPPPRRVVSASADIGRRQLEEVLVPRGIELVRVPVYSTRVSPPRASSRDLAAEGVEAVLVASPSAVEGLLNQARVDPRVAVITIGPTSTDAARARGLAVAAEAARPDLDAIIRALEGALESRPGGTRP